MLAVSGRKSPENKSKMRPSHGQILAAGIPGHYPGLLYGQASLETANLDGSIKENKIQYSYELVYEGLAKAIKLCVHNRDSLTMPVHPYLTLYLSMPFHGIQSLHLMEYVLADY